MMQENPRYFTDGSGRAVYLAGSHVWQSLQDNDVLTGRSGDDPPEAFDFEHYLKILSGNGHNFIRLWRWETPKWSSREKVYYCEQHPWLRSGPGLAADGKPKFDLARFDETYFRRLRERVEAASDLGIYVSVMLFEGAEFQGSDAWTYHPFRAANNINGIDGDTVEGKGIGYTTMRFGAGAEAALEMQRAYVRKLVDTLNDLDNVLYEIGNEIHPSSTEWQYAMIRYIKQYQSTKPKQHPVGMTFQHRGGSNSVLYHSPADWISPKNLPGDSYYSDPPEDYKGKVIVNDTDHLCGHTCGDNIWVWKSFLRGLNPILMEELPDSPTWQDSARFAMGQTIRWAAKINLRGMTPHGELANTKFCLAEPGSEYLVLQPGGQGYLFLDLTGVEGSFAVQWLDLNRDAIVDSASVQGGAKRSFVVPFGGPAVLYLKRSTE